MTTTTGSEDHQNGCLMCAVRALTEGAPAVIWAPETLGESISGVVLRMGELDQPFGPIPFVDLWTGGTDRIRVKAMGRSLQLELAHNRPEVGDTLSVRLDGTRTVDKSKFAGRQVKTFSVEVRRGH